MQNELQQSQESDARREPTLTRDPYQTPLWMKIVGPLFGISAALGTAWYRIDSEFYTKVKHEAGAKTLSDVRYDGKDVLITTFLKNHPDGDILQQEIDKLKVAIANEQRGFETAAREGKISAGMLRRAIRNTEETYTRGIYTILEKTGFETKGLGFWGKGTWQRMRHLGSDTRFGILFTAAVSAAAAFGGFFILNMNNRLRRELTDIHTRLNDEPLPSLAVLPSVAANDKHANDNAPSSKITTEGLQRDENTITPHATGIHA